MGERRKNLKKILIVDDAEINRALLADMLSSEYEILEAENGMEAAAILHNQEQEIALMLLDITMPVMDGFEVLTAMNKNDWIKSVPVIIISAENMPYYVDKAYDLGVQDYISRPFDERTVRRRVHNTIMLFAKQKELSHMLMDQIIEKEKDNKMMIEILSNIVEFRNGESGLHVLHIHTLTELLLKKLLEKTDRYGISKRDIPLICNASSLHDIGKISIPTEILNKPGRLTREEFEIMKTHTLEGARILYDIPMRQNESLVKMGYQICRWHHERYDGRGYPDGLVGEKIPIAAQVVALADVYDALTSKRVYKEAYSHEKTMEMILNGECGAFNPLLLTCLEEISATLKTALNGNFDVELLDSVEETIENGKLDVSERTLLRLEHERMKYRFFANMSQEIQFEYIVIPEMILLSDWGAQHLKMPETILNPRENDFGNRLFSREDFEQLLNMLASTTPKEPIIKKNYLLNIHGHSRWHQVIARSMWKEGTKPQYTGAIGKIVDIHNDLEKIKQLELMAAYDSLTGLLNHKVARERISILLNGKDEEKYILCLLDLDFFKQANDQYGHLFGDEVLKHVGEIIKNSTRKADITARIGGDEFLIFMEYKTTMEPQVKRIFHQLCSKYKDFEISISMGIASSADCKADYETLFQMADKSLYAAKHKGRGTYCFYNKVMENILEQYSVMEKGIDEKDQ